MNEVTNSQQTMPFRDVVQNRLNEYGKKLQCNMFKHTVEVIHQDGSKFLFKNALIKRERIQDYDILFVWTEHCGYHYFFRSDLDREMVVE